MLKPTLQLRLSQQLTMTPQLQQAIRLLQLPVMELQTQILDALEQNIMLEVDEPAAGETAETAESTESAVESDDDRGTDGEERELDTGESIDNSDWDEVQRTGRQAVCQQSASRGETSRQRDDTHVATPDLRGPLPARRDRQPARRDGRPG